MTLSPFSLNLYFLSRRSKHFIASLCPFIPLLPHTLLFLCKFSFLTFSQVKAVGHPGVNCTACNGWWEKKRSQKQFPRISLQGPSAPLPNPVETSSEKEEPPLICQPFSEEEIRREKGSERGRAGGRYRRSHLTRSRSHPDGCYYSKTLNSCIHTGVECKPPLFEVGSTSKSKWYDCEHGCDCIHLL